MFIQRIAHSIATGSAQVATGNADLKMVATVVQTMQDVAAFAGRAPRCPARPRSRKKGVDGDDGDHE